VRYKTMNTNGSISRKFKQLLMIFLTNDLISKIARKQDRDDYYQTKSKREITKGQSSYSLARKPPIGSKFMATKQESRCMSESRRKCETIHEQGKL
jgi:hypothetical protein